MAFIDVVTKEEVVITTDITSFTWIAPNIEESHQINVVTVNVAEHFDWRLECLDDNGLGLQNVCTLSNQFTNGFFLLGKGL